MGSSICPVDYGIKEPFGENQNQWELWNCPTSLKTAVIEEDNFLQVLVEVLWFASGFIMMSSL